MRPALSVIFFTVLSGAGLGLLALIGLIDVFGWPAPLPRDVHLGSGVLALALVAGGLISSTFHLANPKNAWRAVSQFRTSWLSREGVLALIFFPVALVYLGVSYLTSQPSLQSALALASTLLAWAVLFSTGMIYACLKTIPRWNSKLVPAAYLANGHLSGGLVLLALTSFGNGPVASYAAPILALIVLTAAIKAIYFRKFHVPATTHTLSAALGAGDAKTRLFDTGHTHDNFLSKEFFYELGRERARLLRLSFALLSLLIPITALLLAAKSAVVLGGVAALCVIGMLIERWLFFAEAQHVVRLFYGRQSV